MQKTGVADLGAERMWPRSQAASGGENSVSEHERLLAAVQFLECFGEQTSFYLV